MVTSPGYHHDYTAEIAERPSLSHNPGDVLHLDAFQIPLDSADTDASISGYAEFILRVRDAARHVANTYR